MVSAAGSKTAQRAPVKQASEQSVPQSIPTRQRRTSMKARAQRTSKAPGYPRDLVGYGKRLPDPKWPGQARLALQISLNYEAGGELNLLHGDRASEAMLTDIGFPAVRGHAARWWNPPSNTAAGAASGGCCDCSRSARSWSASS